MKLSLRPGWIIQNKKKNFDIQKRSEEKAKQDAMLSIGARVATPTSPPSTADAQNNDFLNYVSGGSGSMQEMINQAEMKRIDKYKNELRQFYDIMLPAADIIAEQRREKLAVMKKRIQSLRENLEPVLPDLKTTISDDDLPADVLTKVASGNRFFTVPKQLESEMTNSEFERHLLKFMTVNLNATC